MTIFKLLKTTKQKIVFVICYSNTYIYKKFKSYYKEEKTELNKHESIQVFAYDEASWFPCFIN